MGETSKPDELFLVCPDKYLSLRRMTLLAIYTYEAVVAS
jgi:hypothetical protein